MIFKSLKVPEKVDKEGVTKTYGKFVFGPLEKGYGVTFGHGLRRILLSSVPGAAIIAVDIEGVTNEFTQIENVKESTIDIILNLKKVRFIYHNRQSFPKLLKLQKSGKGEITAADIECDMDVEVANPEWHIATLSNGADVKMDITVAVGKGYHNSEEFKKKDLTVNRIYVDAVFSPIKRVNYTIENTRVGQRTDYDKLILEVWTDGSVSPGKAIAYAAFIIKEHMNPFITYDIESEEVEELKVDEDKERIRGLLKMPVDEIELSVRAANCLKNANIGTLGDLVSKTEQEMLKYKNFGRKSLNEIIEKIGRMGLNLGMDIEEYQDE